MTRKLRDDCFLHDEDRLSHDEAVAMLRERIRPVVGIEDVPTEEAAGRYLARSVKAPRAIPAHTNSAVDGYAFAFADYDPKNGSTLRVAGRSVAGVAEEMKLARGSAARIFTGATMPAGCDTVVMQEDVEAVERDGVITIAIPPGLKKGANCRLAGEDTKRGEILLHPGQRLRPQDLAAAGAAGLAKLKCHARLDVAICSTGDEIIRPGQALKPGQVYDANAPMLRGLIEATGARCQDLGILADREEIVEQALRDAGSRFDVVITSGGASRGEEDHIVNAMDRLGRLHMWQIAIKPGRPMAFGQIGDCVVLGLPGNPVAVFVCFLLYVRPVLVRLAGGDWPEPVRYPLTAAFSVVKKKTGRREFWRGFLTVGDNGDVAVEKFARDGSGLISSLRAADGLIEVGEDEAEVKQGQMVTFIPFSQFGIPSF